jgi:hypothetical protein
MCAKLCQYDRQIFLQEPLFTALSFGYSIKSGIIYVGTLVHTCSGDLCQSNEKGEHITYSQVGPTLQCNLEYNATNTRGIFKNERKNILTIRHHKFTKFGAMER